jgi:hypothetical protein
MQRIETAEMRRMAKKKATAKYYAEHPEARVKHRASSAKAQKKPAAVKNRVEANKFNRQKKTVGNGDGLDAAHTKKGIIKQSASKNRARKG